jgi:hypothetical protein
MLHSSGVRWAFVLVALLLAACGAATRLVYDNAGAAVLVMANGYLDFDGEQWRLARESIRRFHVWHRRTELPRYAVLLDDAAERVQRGLARDDVDWGIRNVRARYVVLVDAAVRESAPFLDTLDADNIAALGQRFAADDRKRVREELTGDPAKRERTRVASIVKRLEGWTGPVSAGQVELVTEFVRATADHPQIAHAHRQRRQQELLALLHGLSGNGSGPEHLRAFFRAWEAERRSERRAYLARFAQLIVDLDRTLTVSQRARAIERLRRYADDCRQLSRAA